MKKFRSYFGPRVRVCQSNVCPKTGEIFASKTQQSHLESCDVNNIIAHYNRTGDLPRSNRVPNYADVSNLSGNLSDLLHVHASVTEEIRRFRASAKAPVGKPITTPPAPSPLPGQEGAQGVPASTPV